MEYRSGRSDIEVDEDDEDDEDLENQSIKIKKNFNWRSFFNKKKLLDEVQEDNESFDQDLSEFFEIKQNDNDQSIIDHDSLEFEPDADETLIVEELDNNQSKIVISQIARHQLNQLNEDVRLDFPYSFKFLEDLSNSGELIPVFEETVNRINLNRISQINDLDEEPSTVTINQTSDLEKPQVNTKSMTHILKPRPDNSKKSFIDDLSRQIYETQPQLTKLENNDKLLLNNITVLEQAVYEKTIMIEDLEKSLRTNHPDKIEKTEKIEKKIAVKKENLINPIKNNFEAKKKLVQNVEAPKIRLNEREYLNLASNIKVEGASLKTIYLNREISLNGLKRVVEEYLRTGTIEEYLKYELLEHQKDFERDPLLKDLRDQIHQIDPPNFQQFDQLIEEKVQIKNKDTINLPSKNLKEKNVQRPDFSLGSWTSLDVSLLIVIALLVVLILILLIFKI